MTRLSTNLIEKAYGDRAEEAMMIIAHDAELSLALSVLEASAELMHKAGNDLLFGVFEKMSIKSPRLIR